MSSERLKTLISEVRQEMGEAVRRVQFLKTQYPKYKENPEMAASFKKEIDSAISTVASLRKEVKGLTRLKNLYAKNEAKA